MKLNKLRFIPRADLTFTPDEIRIMMKCSALHYDGRCKAISQPGYGSFLYGWANGGSKEQVTSIELDTLIKVLELAAYLCPLDDAKLAFGLQLGLRRVLARVSEGYERDEWLRPATVAGRAALDGESNDAEHDALVKLIEILEEGVPIDTGAAGVSVSEKPEDALDLGPDDRGESKE